MRALHGSLLCTSEQFFPKLFLFGSSSDCWVSLADICTQFGSFLEKCCYGPHSLHYSSLGDSVQSQGITGATVHIPPPTPCLSPSIRENRSQQTTVTVEGGLCSCPCQVSVNELPECCLRALRFRISCAGAITSSF